MSWANRVLPVFMVASGQKPGTLPESASTVQIGTTLHRSLSRARPGFQPLNPSINRTLLSLDNS
jgi:hypothetical protein